MDAKVRAVVSPLSFECSSAATFLFNRWRLMMTDLYETETTASGEK